MAIIGLRARYLTLILAAYGLAGCGITVPNIKEIWDTDRPADPSTQTPKISGAAQIEFEIKKRVYCDLKEAVQEVNRYTQQSSTYDKPTGRQRPLIPSNWGAQISLSLQVEEASSLNPGLTLNQVKPNAVHVFGPGNTVTTPQSSSVGFGGTLSSTATRIDKFDPYYSIALLMKPDTAHSVCHPENDPFTQLSWTPAASSPFILESDLGIKDWLLGAMIVNNLLPSTSPSTQPAGPPGQGAAGLKQDAVSYEIKFVIVSNGNVTPTWKLVRFSANTGNSSFFGLGRTRTHDLIITIGPPTPQTGQSHLASQIGNAVSNGNRALLNPQ